MLYKYEIPHEDDMHTNIRYKQIKAIIDLLRACDKEVTVENIQMIAKVVDISAEDLELEYLLSILRSMEGGGSGR